MTDSARITIRLSKEATEKLQKLVDSGEYKNISDVVRAAIELFLALKFAPPSVKRVIVELPKKTSENLIKLVETGAIEAVNLDDAIRLAVKEYIRYVVSQAAREEIDRAINEIAEAGAEK